MARFAHLLALVVAGLSTLTLVRARSGVSLVLWMPKRSVNPAHPPFYSPAPRGQKPGPFPVLSPTLLLTACQGQPPDPVDELVDVGSHRLHLHCRGQGRPTVIVDVAIGESTESWLPLQDRIAPQTRVCTYQRAGYRPSQPGPFPRDSGRVAGELHALLEAAGEEGPLILVGHSLGGLNM